MGASITPISPKVASKGAHRPSSGRMTSFLLRDLLRQGGELFELLADGCESLGDEVQSGFVVQGIS
jgi:hypothetical protein